MCGPYLILSILLHPVPGLPQFYDVHDESAGLVGWFNPTLYHALGFLVRSKPNKTLLIRPYEECAFHF